MTASVLLVWGGLWSYADLLRNASGKGQSWGRGDAEEQAGRMGKVRGGKIKGASRTPAGAIHHTDPTDSPAPHCCGLPSLVKAPLPGLSAQLHSLSHIWALQGLTASKAFSHKARGPHVRSKRVWRLYGCMRGRSKGQRLKGPLCVYLSLCWI